MDSGIRGFFRKDGRIIPIRDSEGSGRGTRALGKISKAHAAVGAAMAVHRSRKAIKVLNANKVQGKAGSGIKVNRALDLTGLGLSIAGGVVAGVGIGSGAKGLAAGFLASEITDAGSLAANAASVAGHGQVKQRAKQGLKQEARNIIVGNAVWGATFVSQKKNRDLAMAAAKKVLQYGRKALRVIE